MKSLPLEEESVYFFSTRLCTAGGDKKLRCFSVDLKNNSTVQMLYGHESYINDCVFNPIQGNAIASVSGKCLTQVTNKRCLLFSCDLSDRTLP